MAKMNRREFVAATTVAACCCMLGCEFAEAAPQAGATADVGTPADYPAGTISDKFAKSDKLLIVHNGDRIYALSAICTHRKSTVGVKDGRIRCPSHGSLYSEQGKRVSGPATLPLTRHGISLNDAGRLIVDKARQFGEQDWDNPEAYVNVT